MVPHLAELSTKLFQLLFSPPRPAGVARLLFFVQLDPKSFDQKIASENKLQPKFTPICLVESVTLALNDLENPLEFLFLLRAAQGLEIHKLR